MDKEDSEHRPVCPADQSGSRAVQDVGVTVPDKVDNADSSRGKDFEGVTVGAVGNDQDAQDNAWAGEDGYADEEEYYY